MHVIRRHSLAVLIGAGLISSGSLLAACGGTGNGETGSEPAQPELAAETPASNPALEPTPATEAPAAGSATPVEPAAEPAEPAAEPVEPTTEPATEAPITDAPGEPAPATDAPVAESAPVAEAQLGGRSFASDLSADSDFADNILPDLLVDDIRTGEKVNIRNVFPAERPVLFWMWAPH